MTSRADALLDTLLADGAFSVALFDADLRIAETFGGAERWAGAPGAAITEAPLFLGMGDEFRRIRLNGGYLALPTIRVGGESFDIRVVWINAMDRFAAIAQPAGERMALDQKMAQATRENRILEEKVREQGALIAEQHETMRLFIEHAPVCAAMFDKDLSCLIASRRWVEEFGEPRDVEGGYVAPLEREDVREALRLTMDNGVPSRRSEKISRRGQIAWRRWTQAPWRRAGGAVGGLILFCEDATEAMRASSRLRAQTRELGQLDAEMRQFVRALSHDLMAPLRQIDFFSRFLIDVEPSHLDAREADYVQQIRKSSERMDGMAAALARYAHLSSDEFALTPFYLGDAVEVAVSTQRARIARAGAQIELGSMLAVWGDPALMAGVFERLLDNALKYAGPSPRIVIDCIEDDDDVLVRFADDGPGIPAHLHMRARGFFQRLDAPAHIAGAGMGLPECAKIIERHGGALSLDLDYTAGLRVIIALPKSAPTAPGARAIA